MANALYENYRNRLIGDDAAAHGLVDWDTNTTKACLIDSALYTVNLATHQDYSDLAGIVTNGETALTSVTAGDVATGTVDAADTTFSSVTGNESEYVVIYYDVSNDGGGSTDPLLVFFDTFASGMPVTPNGGDITIQWNGSGIFQI